jgi:hypothetical protein
LLSSGEKGEAMICLKCGVEFQPSPDKPGKINVCISCIESPQARLQRAAEEERSRKERARAERKNRNRVEREAKEKAAVEAYGFEIVRRLKGTPNAN